MSARRLCHAAFAALLLVVALPRLAWAVDVATLDAGKGLEVWYVEDHTLPMIAMSASLPAGSSYDPADKPGVAAFAASLLDEGAGALRSQAFQSALNSRGIRLSISPGRDHMTISLVTLSSHAAEAFRLLGLALAHPRFDAGAVARVRAQILAGLKQSEEDPKTIAARGFYRRFFHRHAYAHPVEGTAASVRAITVRDLKTFAKRHWVRGRVKIAVSGDVGGATLKTLLASAFAKIPDAPPPLPPPAKNMGAPGMHVVAMDVPQPSAVFGLPSIKRDDKDFIPAYIANYILGGGGFSSRLMNDVREKRGLTYGISTSLAPYREAGIWVGQVASKKASMRETIEVVRATMKKFATQGPTDKELADAKTYLTGSFPLAFDSNVAIASQLNTFQVLDLPVDYVEKRDALIEAVTAADVARVAGRLFDPAKLTVVVAGTLPPAPKKKPAR
jgi:zinc protease